MSYEEADTIASNVGRGLRSLGQQPNKPLCVFADTRAEWLLSAQVIKSNTNLKLEISPTSSYHFTGLLQAIVPSSDPVHKPWRGCCRSRNQRGWGWDGHHKPWALAKVQEDPSEDTLRKEHCLLWKPNQNHRYWGIQGGCQIDIILESWVSWKEVSWPWNRSNCTKSWDSLYHHVHIRHSGQCG